MNEELAAAGGPRQWHQPFDRCQVCKYYFRATPDSRVQPGDPAECGHPKFGTLLAATLRKAIITNCRQFAND